MSESLQKRLKAVVAALAFLSAASVSATSVFTPVNGTLIDTTITNDSGTISSVTFDLTNTHTSDGSYVVFGGLVDPPFPYFTPSGTSTYAVVGAEGSKTFGFNFTGFQSGQSFTFRWDPDSAIDPLYGAYPKDLVGTKIHAVVDGGPDLRGVMALDTAGNVGVVLSVPEPQTYALMLAGLGVIGMMGRRRPVR